MKSQTEVLNLLYPSGKTTLMQHLQTLVLRGNNHWVGGAIAPAKLEGLVLKMADRYPLDRDERGRTYDRSKGLATVHLVVYPSGGKVLWWLLSSEGKGGLADPASLDAHVAKQAMAADGHIEFEDYVMLYAHKKDARTLTDATTGKEKRVIKDASTWTWKLRPAVLNELQATLAKEVASLNYGDDNHPQPYGVRGFLCYQRRRPLFSGVRSQVLGLHREAIDQWGGVRNQWLGRYTKLHQQYGEQAGQLRSLNEIVTKHLPKMGRFKVFADPVRTTKSLTE